jgi:hypothetical protein
MRKRNRLPLRAIRSLAVTLRLVPGILIGVWIGTGSGQGTAPPPARPGDAVQQAQTSQAVPVTRPEQRRTQHDQQDPGKNAPSAAASEGQPDQARALATDRERLGRPSLRRGWHLFEGPRKGGAALLQDLLGLTSRVAFVEACWTIVLQAALASHDQDLEQTARRFGAETLRQRAWLDTKLTQVAPQALMVPAPPQERSDQQPMVPAGRAVIRTVADGRSMRPLVPRGLRGPTRTTHLLDT